MVASSLTLRTLPFLSHFPLYLSISFSPSFFLFLFLSLVLYIAQKFKLRDSNLLYGSFCVWCMYRLRVGLWRCCREGVRGKLLLAKVVEGRCSVQGRERDWSKLRVRHIHSCDTCKQNAGREEDGDSLLPLLRIDDGRVRLVLGRARENEIRGRRG